MRLCAVVTIAALVGGCAARAGVAPVATVVNLSAAWANKRPLVWKDAAGCHVVIERADGVRRAVPMTADECVWSETWVTAQAAVAKPPAAPATPTPAP